MAEDIERMRRVYNPRYKTSTVRPELTTKDNTIPERELYSNLSSYRAQDKDDARSWLIALEKFRTENPRYDHGIRNAQASYLEEAGYEGRFDFDNQLRIQREMEQSQENPWFKSLTEWQRDAVLDDMRINPDLIGEYQDYARERREQGIDKRTTPIEWERPPKEWLTEKINHQNWEGNYPYFDGNDERQKRHYEEVFEEYDTVKKEERPQITLLGFTPAQEEHLLSMMYEHHVIGQELLNVMYGQEGGREFYDELSKQVGDDNLKYRVTQLYHDKYEEWKNKHETAQKMSFKGNFSDLATSLQTNANFEIKSAALGDEVSVFPGSTGKSGLGIRHIIEERTKKDNLSPDEITALSALVLDTVQSGKITRDNGSRCEFSKNGILAIVRKDFDDENQNWVLTGFAYNGDDQQKKREATETIQTVIARYGNTPEYSSFRSQVGAVIASLDKSVSHLQENASEKHADLEKLVYKHVNVDVDGTVRECKAGLLDGFKNAVRSIERQNKTIKALTKENERLKSERERSKKYDGFDGYGG